MNTPGKILLLSLLLSLTACVAPGIQSVKSTADLGSDEVMIVGKIRLVPKYHPSEQDLPTLMFNKDLVRDKLFVAIDKEHKPLDDYATFSGIDKVASVDFNKTFMIAAKRTKPLIFSGAFFMISADRSADFYQLPGGLKFNYGKKDKAIYIGTIEFHRNDYDEITKVNLKDEYREANKVFKKIHGKKIKLKKIKPVVL
jgi:hypothetical protein